MLKKYLIPVFISLAFFFAYARVSLSLYGAHQTRGDLTAYAQGMWNTVHGHFMASTYNYSVHNYWDKQYREIRGDNSNIFGIHFNPILLVFMPVYWAFQAPETLLFLQALFTAVGGFLIYCLAKKMLKHDSLAYLIQASYLLYFATVSATLSQFHAYTLALCFGPLLLLASRYRNTLIYYLSLALFLLVQENTSLVATFFGIYLMLSSETRRRGLVTLLVSGTYFTLVIGHLIPALSPYHFYLFGSIYGNKLGGNIQEIILHSLRNPQLFLETVATPENIVYMRNLLIGITPFAWLSPAMLFVGFSALAQNILSSSLGLKTQLMHYESGSVAFLFYAIILGLESVLQWKKMDKQKYTLPLCLIVLIIFTGISYKKFTAERFNPTLLRLNLYTQKDQEMDDMLAHIPMGTSVSTQDYLSAQLSNRVGLYQFPVYQDQVDYVLISKKDETWPLTQEEQYSYIKDLRNNPNRQIAYETVHFILFSRR